MTGAGGALVDAGLLGALSTAGYLVALRHVCWPLVPRAARRRVRWWAAHAGPLLVVSLAVLLAGLCWSIVAGL